MRWLFGGATALFLAWAGYVGSPYIVLLRLASAVASADAGQLEDRINVRALRVSLARQIVADGLSSKAVAALGGSENDLAKTTIAIAADPFLEAYVTPPNVGTLLSGIDVGELAGSGSGFVGRLSGTARAIGVLAAGSKWRGFRNVYFTLSAGRPADGQVRLQLRLSRLSWRLVGLDLPADVRRRVANALLRSKGEAER